MSQITEWEFTADVASQINEILKERVDLPFSEAKCEQRKIGTIKRRDITLLNRVKKPVFTGEVKMPDKRDGRSPLNESVVIDAHNKANAIGVEYFFTWNVNDCVLWKTFEQGKSITERHLEFLKAFPAPIIKSDDLLMPRVQEQVKSFLKTLLDRCAAILSGEKPLAKLPLDETFINVWELALAPLVTDTLREISFRYDKDKRFHKNLDEWMREGLGLLLSQKDEEIIRQNLFDTAKQSCFVLANKIVFYKALRQKFDKLKNLEIGEEIKSDAQLKNLIEKAFEHAREITLDYETVFEMNFGDSLTLLSKNSSELWQDLIKDTDKFDFTQLNYEVIGQIFERLFDVEERHKFGQHYTRSEIVDLINAFCIRKADAKVLDPSCGGGTFLVRAYQRKKDLSGGKLSHQQLIGQIYGTDISAYPVHLTTINLATRDLKEGANYPLVARKDFLKTKLNDKIFNVPNESGENLQPLPKLDAIVGNPPYIRQEKITEYYGKTYKDFLQETVRKDAPHTELSGRSDILCYFFTHSFAILEEDGYIGLLTSSNWLDTAYGFDLQKFLLENFEIIAVFESNCEPWFTGARVTTAATILRKQTNAEKRNANNVKFVWLKKPIADFVSYSKGDEEQRRATFERIREQIENLTKEIETDTWRVRVVNQAELFQAGYLSFDVQAEDEENELEPSAAGGLSAVKATQTNFLGKPEQPSLQIASDNPKTTSQNLHSEYKGYKWGIFLRAPEIFNKLLKHGGNRFVPLGQIAEVRFGVKSGCDAFFFPKDMTAEKLAENLTDADFKERYGITKKQTEKIRIVHAGDKSQHLIEAEYLEPEIHSLMEIDSFEIKGNELGRKIILVSESKDELKGKNILKYIKWGEREKFDERITVANRISTDKEWYDLTHERPAQIILPKLQQYRHIISLNSELLLNNSSLLSVYTSEEFSKELCAILNSTFVALSKQFFGRIHGAEGSLQLDVYSAQMMFVPNPREATSQTRKKIVSAFDLMRKRKALPMVDVDSNDEENWTGELALADRQALDDAVLELIGIDDAEERKELRDELYREITKLYRQIRVAEKIMQKFRSASARKGKQTAHSIADEIWTELTPQPTALTPLKFVPDKTKTEKINLPLGRARVVTQGLLGTSDLQVGDKFIPLGSVERSNFVKTLSDLALHGALEIPVSPEVCQNALQYYEKEFGQLNDLFYSEAATFTADENLKEKVVKELWKKLRSS
jgi:methylase of polypeptide subunit release factors